VDLGQQQTLTGLAGSFEDVQYGSSVNVTQPRGSANAVASDLAVKDTADGPLPEPHIGSEWRRAREPFIALLAFPPLDIVASLPGPYCFDLAVVGKSL